MSEIDEPTTIITVVFVMIATVFFIIQTIGFIEEYSGELVRPSLQKITIVSATHSMESCLKTKEKITEFDLANKLNDCRSDTGLDYVEVVDIEDSKKWFSGDASASESSHEISINIEKGGEAHLARLYVKS